MSVVQAQIPGTGQAIRTATKDSDSKSQLRHRRKEILAETAAALLAGKDRTAR